MHCTPCTQEILFSPLCGACMLIHENMPGVRMVSGIYAWLQLCKLKHVESIQGVVEQIVVILAESTFHK